MSLYDTLSKIRRFSRDLDGAIWSDDDLMNFWNESQLELVQKTSILENIESHRYPPEYTWSYLFGWEREYTDGDRIQCLNINQLTGDALCYPWEAFYWGTQLTTSDSGTRFTHPWEAFFTSNPADVVRVKLNSQCLKMKYLAYDELKLDPISEKDLSESDGYYRTTMGLVTHYWRPDEYSNQIVLYPRPAAVRFQELVDTEIFDSFGGPVSPSEAWLDSQDTGITIDIIDTEDAIFTVYESIPWDITTWVDSNLDLPDWTLKYVMYGVLERAFGSDSDMFIPTLRDYWKGRKELGIQALKKFKRMRSGNRDVVMGRGSRGGTPRRGRLPAGYPAI